MCEQSALSALEGSENHEDLAIATSAPWEAALTLPAGGHRRDCEVRDCQAPGFLGGAEGIEPLAS